MSTHHNENSQERAQLLTKQNIKKIARFSNGHVYRITSRWIKVTMFRHYEQVIYKAKHNKYLINKLFFKQNSHIFAYCKSEKIKSTQVLHLHSPCSRRYQEMLLVDVAPPQVSHAEPPDVWNKHRVRSTVPEPTVVCPDTV